MDAWLKSPQGYALAVHLFRFALPNRRKHTAHAEHHATAKKEGDASAETIRNRYQKQDESPIHHAQRPKQFVNGGLHAADALLVHRRGEVFEETIQALAFSMPNGVVKKAGRVIPLRTNDYRAALGSNGEFADGLPANLNTSLPHPPVFVLMRWLGF